MRILRICQEIPYPPSDGIRIEPFHITKALADRGHEITLVGFQNDARDVSPLTEYCEVRSIPFRGRNSAFSLAIGVLQHFPVNYVKYRDAKLLSQTMDLLQSRPYDAVIVDYSAMGWFALQIRKQRPSIPIVTRWHNVDSLIWERWTDGQQNPVSRTLGRVQSQLVRHFERLLATTSDACVTVGAKDTEFLRTLAPAAHIEFIPAGIDVDHYAPYTISSPGEATAKDILFLASGYRWHANWDAVKWLYEQIMPRVWKLKPETTLYITGADLRPEMRQWASRDRVVLTGFVPDEREVMAKCALMVVPMRLGGGIKLKILTAFAMSKAVVTTSDGAEGIARLVNGQHCLVRDSPDEFATAVAGLIGDVEFREHLGANGRKLVCDSYDWRILATRWEELLLSILPAQVQDRVRSAILSPVV